MPFHVFHTQDMTTHATPSLTQRAISWDFCRDPQGWRPFDPTRVDFTPCVEHTFLFGIPALVTTMLFLVRINRLKASGTPPFRFGRTNWIYWGSQICIALALSALLLSTATYFQLPMDTHLSTPTFLFGTISMSLAWITALFVNDSEHKYSTRSSDHLFVFYVYSILAAGTIYLTLDSTSTPDTESSTNILLGYFRMFLISLGIGFIIEAYPRTNTQVQQLARHNEHQTIEEQANFYSRIAFHYIDPLMKLGTERPLKDEEVPEMMKRSQLTEANGERLGRTWQEVITRKLGQNGSTKERPVSLLWTIFRMGWVRIFMMTLLRVIGVFLKFLTPVCMKYILLFIQQRSDAPHNPDGQPDNGDETLWPTRFGVLLAVTILVLNVARAILISYSMMEIFLFGMEIRSGLIQLIYLKSLVLSPQARQANTVGSIVNRMSVDADKWVNQFLMMPWTLSLPFEVGAGLFMRKMGKIMSISEDEKLGHMDNRIRLMTEILSGIKVIKLYGWEESFLKKVGGVRRKELVALRRVATLRALLVIMFSSTTLLMALATFTCYALIGGPGFTRGKMTADVIFVAITLFGMISSPMAAFSHCYKDFISISVSTNRIQELLMASELEHVVDRYPRPPMTIDEDLHDRTAIEFENATMTWVRG
ncbi:hypothetical protein BGW42_006606, partial [Actinomortierella wolfii]